MKKIILPAIAACLLAVCSGCSGFLDEKLKSSLAPDNTYTSSYGFEVGVTGLYGWARSEFNTWGDATTTQGQACPYEAFQVATDIVYTGHKDGSLVPFENLSYTASTTFVTSYWNWAYGLIASANEILEYSEGNVNWDTSTDKAYYQAVARFFRAYAYRYLVYLYGDIPYVDKIEKNFRVDFTRTPKAEVLSKMIEDLQFAIDNLPVDPDKVKVGQLTKWAAQHLLSEVYLMSGEYAKAETAALTVINSGYFHLMTSRFGVDKDQEGDSFSDMFKEYNQNRTSGNMESIWVMQLEYNTTGGGGEYEDWTRRAWLPKYYNEDGFVLADSLGGRGLAQIVPFKWWIESADFFAKSDIRNSEYNIKRNWYYNNVNSNKYGKKAEFTDETWAKCTLFPAVTKFFYGKPDNLSYAGSNKDRMKFRLAETYLLLAEARLDQNNPQGAAEAINVVRRRAGAPEITANQATIDFLLDERIRELVGEELRRFTLVRTGKLVERTKKYNSYSSSMDEHNTLWPIPQTIIDSNTGADFPQNPGY
ncbi:RagB/SusD family nutrient uptake outer membrane protein [Parabacteroides sp. Marseille-P3160]|uniref:RagB/SusD family nutrient uptake outer membrane protein n=1 Tax=Parabacteroides sp. Marseille-P3160 TaxID=1917887 RepID=UPI0009B976C6|nr:RagB/SusD family nutrient uptake outer membrane protein [Parabacteroides sp. Marseille-P3160]